MSVFFHFRGHSLGLVRSARAFQGGRNRGCLAASALAAAVALLFFQASRLLAETVHMANHPIPAVMSQSLPHGGALPQLAIEALESQGIHVVVHWYPTKRAFAAVKKGICDMSLGWCKDPERQPWVVFSSEDIGRVSVVLAHLKTTQFDWQTLEDLEGLTIGARLGSRGYGNAFLAAESSGKLMVERVHQNRLNLAKLLAGRIDLMVELRFILRHLIQTHACPADRALIRMHPKPLHSQLVYAIFNPGVSPGIIRAFDAGIAQMKKSKEFNRRMSGLLN